MRVWRMSLRRMRSAIISWHGSFVDRLLQWDCLKARNAFTIYQQARSLGILGKVIQSSVRTFHWFVFFKKKQKKKNTHTHKKTTKKNNNNKKKKKKKKTVSLKGILHYVSWSFGLVRSDKVSRVIPRKSRISKTVALVRWIRKQFHSNGLVRCNWSIRN